MFFSTYTESINAFFLESVLTYPQIANILPPLIDFTSAVEIFALALANTAAERNFD